MLAKKKVAHAQQGKSARAVFFSSSKMSDAEAVRVVAAGARAPKRPRERGSSATTTSGLRMGRKF